MTKLTINIGVSANDGTGDTLRSAGQKINSNFTELYNNIVEIDPNPNNRIQSSSNGLYVPPVADAEILDLNIIFENALI